MALVSVVPPRRVNTRVCLRREHMSISFECTTSPLTCSSEADTKHELGQGFRPNRGRDREGEAQEKARVHSDQLALRVTLQTIRHIFRFSTTFPERTESAGWPPAVSQNRGGIPSL